MSELVQKKIPTTLEKIKRELKIRFVSNDEIKQKIRNLKDLMIRVLKDKYPYVMLFISKYTRFSSKHQKVLVGLLVVYWTDSRKPRISPNIYVLCENENSSEVDNFIDLMSRIDEEYLVNAVNKGLPVPKILKEFISENRKQ